MKPNVYALMTVKNRWEYTEICIKSLLKQTYDRITIIVVDDGSTDDTKSILQTKYPEVVRLEGDGNLWWTGGMNLGMKYILEKSTNLVDYVLLLNNDTTFDNQFVQRLVTSCVKNNNSPVGSISKSFQTKQVAYHVHKQVKGKTTPVKIDISSYKDGELIYDTDCLNTKGTIVPISVFRKVGMFSKLFPHYAADWDFFYRVKKAGYTLAIDPKSVVFSLNDDKGLSERIREKNKITLKEFFQLFFNRRSSFNLYSTLLHIFLYIPFPQKMVGIFRTMIGVPYIFIIKVILGSKSHE